MIFVHDGLHYDTARMRQFQTGDPELPLICRTTDCGSVFLFSPAYNRGLRVTKASARAVYLASVGYRLPSLLDVTVAPDARN
jgi:hypothetical protein